MFSFSDLGEETGHPLVVTGIVAKQAWISDNPEAVTAIIEGTDSAMEWMRSNPDEFNSGGKYADLAEAEGWLQNPAATTEILGLMEDGRWFFDSSVYTDDWIASTYEFIKTGEGILLPEAPPSEDIFYPPME